MLILHHYKILELSCDKNGLFPPEMITKMFKCSPSIFDQTKSPSFKLTEIWLALLISCDKVRNLVILYQTVKLHHSR